MPFPDEIVNIERLYQYNPSGIDIETIYPSGEYINLSSQKSGRLKLVPELTSPLLKAYNSPLKLEAGRFDIVTSGSPAVGDVYINPATGDFLFNASEPQASAYFFYYGYGSLATASGYYNKISEVVEDIQEHISPSGTSRINTLEINLDDHLADDNPHNITPSSIGASPSGHEHGDIYYEKNEVDTLLTGYLTGSQLADASGYLQGQLDVDASGLAAHLSADNPHNISPSSIQAAEADHNHDDRYFTESETTTLLSDYTTIAEFIDASGDLQSQINANASGVANHNHDDRYYTETEIDATFADYTTNANFTAASGYLQGQLDIDASGLAAHEAANNPHSITPSGIGAALESHTHDDRYYTETELDTIFDNYTLTSNFVDASGHLQSQIDSNASGVVDASGYLHGLIDIDASGLADHLAADNPHNITASGIGAALEDHNHDSRYYTESELDTTFGDYTELSVFIDASSYLQSGIDANASGIDTKEDAISAGTTDQYWRGDKSWQTLDTDAVAEGSNEYFTNERVYDALNGTAPILFSSGVISILEASASGNGYLTSSDWSAFNDKQDNLGSAATHEFLRGDGTWDVPQILGSGFDNPLISGSYLNIQTASGVNVESPYLSLDNDLHMTNPSGVIGLAYNRIIFNYFDHNGDPNTADSVIRASDGDGVAIEAQSGVIAEFNYDEVHLYRPLFVEQFLKVNQELTDTYGLSVLGGSGISYNNALVAGPDGNLTIYNKFTADNITLASSDAQGAKLTLDQNGSSGTQWELSSSLASTYGEDDGEFTIYNATDEFAAMRIGAGGNVVFAGNLYSGNIFGGGYLSLNGTVRIGSTGVGTLATNTTIGDLTFLDDVIRHVGSAGPEIQLGTTILDLDFSSSTNTTAAYRIGRGTDTGTGTLQTQWHAGQGAYSLAMYLDHKAKWLRVYGEVIFDGQCQSYTGGSSGTPAFSYINDTDTGMYFPSANSLGFATGGTARVAIENGGMFTTVHGGIMGSSVNPRWINIPPSNAVGGGLLTAKVSAGAASPYIYWGPVSIATSAENRTIIMAAPALIPGTVITSYRANISIGSNNPLTFPHPTCSIGLYRRDSSSLTGGLISLGSGVGGSQSGGVVYMEGTITTGTHTVQYNQELFIIVTLMTDGRAEDTARFFGAQIQVAEHYV